jgi:hypothetical protein
LETGFCFHLPVRERGRGQITNLFGLLVQLASELDHLLLEDGSRIQLLKQCNFIILYLDDGRTEKEQFTHYSSHVT